MNKTAGPDKRGVVTANDLTGDKQTEAQSEAYESQYDRPVRKTPGAGGQLVTAGELPDLISSSAGARVS